MKKYLLTCCFFLAVLPSSVACDVCGCGVSGGYMGIMPQFTKNFIGLRWQYLSFASTSHHDGTLSNEYFHDANIWTRWYPNKRWQIMSVIPARHTYRKYNGIYEQQTGLSDITLLATYMPINTGDSLFNSIKHTLLVGGGVKLPTGKFNSKTNTETGLWKVPPGMQLGSGSLDYLAQVNYTIRFGKWGVNTTALYRYNTENNYDYKYGNQLNGQLAGFYWLKFKKVTILPQLGIWYSQAAKDEKYKRKEEITGGWSLRSNAGADIYYKQLSVGLHWQAPISDHLSDGWTKAQQGMSMQFIYIF